MAIPDVTVVLAVTDHAKWGQAAAMAAFTCAQHCRPKEIRIATYEGGSVARRVSRKYKGILPPFSTKWVLHVDADSVFTKPLDPMIEQAGAMNVKVGARHSPLQLKARCGWSEEQYRMLWKMAGMPYCKMATTCAVLMQRDYATKIFPRVEHWRQWIDRQHTRLARVYHHAQAAFTLACAEQGVREKDIWWFDHRQLAWPTEQPGIIVHGGRKQFQRILERWMTKKRF